MNHKWQNTSSFSRSDKERKPKEWTLDTGLVQIVIHRNVHYEPDVWLVSCRELGMMARPLKEKDSDLAKNEALNLVRVEFTRRLASIPYDATDA